MTNNELPNAQSIHRTIFLDIAELLTLEGAVVKGARFVTEDDLTVIREAAIVCEGGKICWIGAQKDLGKMDDGQTEIVSLRGRTVIPGFVESHTHLVFAGNRAHEFEKRIRGETYQQIAREGGGIRFTVEQTRTAPYELLRAEAQARADRFVKQGVTCLEVKSGYGLNLEGETRSLEIARGLQGPKIVTTFLGPHAQAPEHPDLESYMNEICSTILPQLAQRKLVDRADIYIEKGFFTLALGRRYLECVRALGLAVTGHVEQLSEMGGADLLLEFAPQSVDHLVFVSDQTIVRLAKAKQTTAVLLPASDFYLRMAYPRARAMLDQGVRVALSTDFNPGTSPTQDLSLVGVLARLEMRMTLAEVLVAYTLGAAFALGLQHRAGSLSVGKDCDFNVLEGSWRDLFYGVGHHPVSGVYRLGKCLHKNN